jgi:hypothetical protein
VGFEPTTFGYPDILPKDILPKETLPKDILQNGHFAERTFCRTDVLPNGRFAERTFCRTDILPKGKLAENRERVLTSGRKQTSVVSEFHFENHGIHSQFSGK